MYLAGQEFLRHSSAPGRGSPKGIICQLQVCSWLVKEKKWRNVKESKDSALGLYISRYPEFKYKLCVSFVSIALPNHVKTCILGLVML
jgi:hypothetical protein